MLIWQTLIMTFGQYTLLPESGVKTNYQSWNATQNRYDSIGYKPKRRPPVKLIRAIIREFERWCKDYHIDVSKYLFIEPCEIEGTWSQFDFLDSTTEKYPARIKVHSIISDNNGKIFQRIFDV